MTFEEMERAMQFILAQQAKFEADLTRISETMDKHAEGIGGLLQISRTLINSQIAAEGRMAIIEEKMTELAAAEKRTDQRLDSFIDFFERDMRRGSEPERTH
jgi:hypothetical protein